MSLCELLGSHADVWYAIYLSLNKISQEICKIITTGRTCTVRLIKLSTVTNCYFQKIMYIRKKEKSEPKWKTREDRVCSAILALGSRRVT